MEKLFYGIGEVARMLGTSVSQIRYWSDYFSDVIGLTRPQKGSRRKYTPDQTDTLRQIQFLAEKQGLTLEGVKTQLKRDGRRSRNTVKAVESLKNIREMLLEIRNTI